VLSPVSGVGSLNGSLLGCLRKDLALCHTASRGWVRGSKDDISSALETVVGDGTFYVHRLAWVGTMQVKNRPYLHWKDKDGRQNLHLHRIWGVCEKKFY